MKLINIMYEDESGATNQFYVQFISPADIDAFGKQAPNGS